MSFSDRLTSYAQKLDEEAQEFYRIANLQSDNCSDDSDHKRVKLLLKKANQLELLAKEIKQKQRRKRTTRQRGFEMLMEGYTKRAQAIRNLTA